MISIACSSSVAHDNYPAFVLVGLTVRRHVVFGCNIFLILLMAILARLKIFLTEELQTHSRSVDFKMECQWTAKRCSLIGILSALISLNFSIYNVELLNLKLYYVKSFLLRYFLSKLRLHRNILILNRYSVNLLSLKEDFLFGSKHLAVQKLVLINFTRNNF